MNNDTDPFTHACNVLDFRQLLELLAARAGTGCGRKRILGWRPSRNPAEAAAGHPLLAGLMTFHAAGHGLPAPAFPDLDDILRHAAPEGVILAGDELLPCRRLLENVRDTAAAAGRREVREQPALSAFLLLLQPVPLLLERLQRALDENGQLLDGASPFLKETRQELRHLEQRIQRHLEPLVRKATADGWLQESFITQRQGRYVIPLKRDARSRLTGIIHDHSDSGRTLFVEPAETVPLGNELADLRLEEQDECRRILAELTGLVQRFTPELQVDQELLTELDAVRTVAAWAVENDARLPVFGSRLRLQGARHPLLLDQFRRAGRADALVPLDLALPENTRVLLITGPNSGGKTAALKTVGLLTLMAQAGLPVTTGPDSELRFFDRLEADIGDEQSLAASLSTFTAHLSRLGAILRQPADQRMLVLLDEIGAGTDPVEGGALACAVLSTLAGKAGLTLATSHLGVVKSYVHDQPEMLNAAARFNLETLSPEFVLDLGHPGASQALTIAGRVGFPVEILDQARRLLSKDHLRLEDMLSSIDETQREMSQKEREVQTLLQGLSVDREKTRVELRELRQERKRLLHEAYQQAAGIVENARRDMERLLAGLNRTASESQVKEVAQAVTREVRETVLKRETNLQTAAEGTAPKPEHPLPVGRLTPGQTVWVEKLNANAVVESVAPRGDKIVVRVGTLHFTVAAREIGQQDTAAASPEGQPLAETRPRVSGPVATELLLIGKRVDEALPVLDQFLNRAGLAGLPEVRIVHGFGTGRLQEAVHEFLKTHPLVRRFRLGRQGTDPGGAGATLVLFTDSD